MILEINQVLNETIHFVNIDKRYTHKGEYILEFTLWLRQVDLNITAYRLRYPIEEAMEILRVLERRKIPSNFHIFELRDETILMGLTIDDLMLSDKEISNLQNVNKIELILNPDSLQCNLFRLIEQGASLFYKPSNEFHDMRNLVYNRNNTDISMRMFTPDYGFSTRGLEELFMAQVTVRTQGELDLDSKYIRSTRQIGEDYESVIDLTDCESETHRLYINDSEMNQVYIMSFLSREMYIELFSSMFDHTVAKNIMEVISRRLYGSQDFPEATYNRSRSSQERVSKTTLTIKPLYRIPTISRLDEMLESLSKEDIDKWINMLRTEYEEEVQTIARDTIEGIDFENSENTQLHIILANKQIKQDYAETVMKATALKYTLSVNDVFNQVYAFTKTTKHSSYIFNADVEIKPIS